MWTYIFWAVLGFLFALTLSYYLQNFTLMGAISRYADPDDTEDWMKKLWENH